MWVSSCRPTAHPPRLEEGVAGRRRNEAVGRLQIGTGEARVAKKLGGSWP